MTPPKDLCISSGLIFLITGFNILSLISLVLPAWDLGTRSVTFFVGNSFNQPLSLPTARRWPRPPTAVWIKVVVAAALEEFYIADFLLFTDLPSPNSIWLKTPKINVLLWNYCFQRQFFLHSKSHVVLACICPAKGNVTRLSDQTAASLPASELDFHYGSPYTSFHANVCCGRYKN